MKQQGMTKLSSGITVVRELENGVLKIRAYHPMEWKFRKLQWWKWNKAKQTIKRLING
jgi:hypothetical protein